VTPTELLHHVAERLWAMAEGAARDLAAGATDFPFDQSAPPCRGACSPPCLRDFLNPNTICA
jgi:hypothetical protein